MKTCTLDGIDVAYEEFGRGRPILFLHGWNLDHTSEVADYEPVFADRPGWCDCTWTCRATAAPPQQRELFKILVHDWLDRVEEAENQQPVLVGEDGWLAR